MAIPFNLGTPGARNSLASRFVDREDIQPIDSDTGHIVACSPVSDITTAHMIGDGGGLGIAVVLGNEYNW